MKKLMFILAAVAMATSVQAASVVWTCTNVKDGSGNPISGVAYFIDAAALSQSDFTALKGADAFNTALSGMYSWTPATAGKYSSSATNAELGLTDATTGYTAYIAVFDTATITDSSKYYLTAVSEPFDTLAGSYEQQVKWGSQSSASQAAGAWADVKTSGGSGGVPEPTSGLLLLMGGAMLALRRRRA